jgi:hypothetical protein
VLSDIGLQVAEAKSGVKAVAAGFEFLGFTFQWRFLRPRPLALVRFKDQVRSCTRRQAPISLQSMIEGLNPSFVAGATTSPRATLSVSSKISISGSVNAFGQRFEAPRPDSSLGRTCRTARFAVLVWSVLS